MAERRVDWLDLLACEAVVIRVNAGYGLGADEALVATAAAMLAAELPAGRDVEMPAQRAETALRFLKVMTA